MSAGDLKGCLRLLESLLRAIKYPRDVDYNGLSKGDPSAFLPIVDFTLTTFSPLLTAQLVTAEFEFAGKTDLRFTDTVYKVLRDIFQYKPVLSKQQFLQSGFSQSKISVVCDIINLALQRHKQLKKERRNVRPSHSPSLLVNKVVPLNTKNSVCKQPYFASTIGVSLPFPSHSCSKENHGLLNSHQPQNNQLQNEGKDDLPNDQAVEDRKPMEMEALPMALEKLSTLGTRLEYLPLALEKLSTLGTRLETLPIVLERLSMLETRLDVLEKHLEKHLETWGDAHKNQDFVNIPKETWDNLLSRVVLLETKLELASIQREPLDGCKNNGQAITQVLPLTLSSSPPLSCPPQDNLNDRLERITSMMKNTSSMLKSLDVSI